MFLRVDYGVGRFISFPSLSRYTHIVKNSSLDSITLLVVSMIHRTLIVILYTNH